MKKIIYFIVAALLTLTGCSDDFDNVYVDTEDSNKLTLQDYFSLLGKNYQAGTILLMSNDTEFSQNLNLNERIVTLKELQPNQFKKNSKTKVSLSDLNKNKIEFAKEEKGLSNYSNPANLFGQTISYSQNSETGKGGDTGGTFYIPELISASIDTEYIQEGTTISWNIDEDNENGVVIWVEYSPVKQGDFSLALDNQQTIRRGFAITDTEGSYTVKSSDINIFPNDAELSVYIARGNFNFLEDDPDEGTLAILAITKVEFSKSIKK